MKARIKGTNIIVECIGIGTLINENNGIKCKHSNGAMEVIPGDCLVELENDFDWKSFRAEAAKDILCHLLGDRYTGDSDNKGFVFQAIGIANELVKQLKENE